MERQAFIELWKALCAGETITDIIIDESFSLNTVPKAAIYTSSRKTYSFPIKPLNAEKESE